MFQLGDSRGPGRLPEARWCSTRGPPCPPPGPAALRLPRADPARSDLDVDLLHVLVPDRVAALGPRRVPSKDDLVPDVVRGDGVRSIRVHGVARGQRRVLEVLNGCGRGEWQRDDVVEVRCRLREREDDGVAVRRLDPRHAVHAVVDERRASGGALRRVGFSNAVQNAPEALDRRRSPKVAGLPRSGTSVGSVVAEDAACEVLPETSPAAAAGCSTSMPRATKRERYALQAIGASHRGHGAHRSVEEASDTAVLKVLEAGYETSLTGVGPRFESEGDRLVLGPGVSGRVRGFRLLLLDLAQGAPSPAHPGRVSGLAASHDTAVEVTSSPGWNRSVPCERSGLAIPSCWRCRECHREQRRSRRRPSASCESSHEAISHRLEASHCLQRSSKPPCCPAPERSPNAARARMGQHTRIVYQPYASRCLPSGVIFYL